MKAIIVSTNDLDGAEIIECNGHRIQYGGAGFCHTHGSFDCIDNLTDEEKEAIEKATPPQKYTLAGGHSTNEEKKYEFKLHLVPYRDPEKDSEVPSVLFVDEPTTLDDFILTLEEYVSSLIEFKQCQSKQSQPKGDSICNTCCNNDQQPHCYINGMAFGMEINNVLQCDNYGKKL